METNQNTRIQIITYAILGVLFSIGMMFCYGFYGLLLGKISEIASGSDTRYFMKIGIIACLLILIVSIGASMVRDRLYIRHGRHIVHNSRKTWRITWIIGGLLSLLAWRIDHHILFFNWYFFAVGLIPLFNSFFKYADVDEAGLTLFHGVFFNRKKFFINWFRVSDIRMDTITKTRSVSGGGRVWVTVKEDYEDDVFKIILNEPLTPQDIVYLKKENTFNIFVNEYTIDDKGDEIILNTEPEGGFHGFLNLISKFKHLENGEAHKRRGISYYAIETFAVLIFFVVMIMQFVAVFVQATR